MKADKSRIAIGDGVFTFVLFGAVAVLAFLFLFPVLFSILSAFKTNGEILRDPIALPSALRLENFVYLFQKTRFAEALLNSAFLTVTAEALIIFIIPMAAYGIERCKSRLTNVLYLLFLVGMMVPFQVFMIPLFRELKLLGLFGNHAGPLVVYLSGACSFGILLFVSFLKGVPKEIEESATIDGAGPFRTFWVIVFPLLAPCTASLVVLNGMGIWNDFLMPLLVLPSDRAKTVNVEIYSFVGEFASRWDVVFAGVVVAMLPVLVIFLLLQRYFIKGISAGASKG